MNIFTKKPFDVIFNLSKLTYKYCLRFDKDKIVKDLKIKL